MKFNSKINFSEFKLYFRFTILLIITLLIIGNLKLTEARYESSSLVTLSPDIAFFIVDVESQTGQIKLDGIIPRTNPYTYTFSVSNFNSEKKANVDLTYSIEIICTTNIPLNYRIYKAGNMNNNVVDSDTVVTDDNGVFYRHLVINEISTFSYSQRQTDLYTLQVEFPVQYANMADSYAGIIELVDIKINAEQVV